MSIQPDPTWRNAGILIVAHGAREHPEACADTEGHASRLRSLGWFKEVETAFFAGGKSLTAAIAAMTAETICVVPHFMGVGYFVRHALPNAIEKANDRRAIVVTQPPSTHPDFPGLVREIIEETCSNAGVDLETCSVVLAAHGSETNPASANHTRWVAARLSGFGSTKSAYLGQAPRLDDVLRARVAPTVVAGLFAARGSHAAADVPAAIQSASTAGDDRNIIYTGPIGASERITSLFTAQIGAVDLSGGRVAGPR